MASPPGAQGQGFVRFAAAMLALAGVINITEWFVALVNAAFYAPSPTYLFADTSTWGFIEFIIGLIQLLACFAIGGAQPWGRGLGIGIAIASVVGQLFLVNAAPWWTLVVIGIDILIIYALARYGVEPVVPVELRE